MATESSQIRSRVVQIILGLVAMIALVLAVVISGRVAVSRILVRYGAAVADPAAVNQALGLTPDDAEAHYTRGAVSNYLDQPAAALSALESAVSLRPRDYYLWLELGLARDRLGDSAGSLLGFNESVRLAPYYAQPRWQRGNLLFRMGRYNEAFAELRQAVTSYPDYLPNFIDLAWNASGKDARLTEQVVQAQSNKAHLAMAVFFADHGKADEALAHFRSIQNISTENRRRLLQALLSAGTPRQAFEVWSSTFADGRPTPGIIYDGGFEGPLNLDDVGFGWHVARGEPGLSFSLDGGQPQSGSRSLRIDFSGNPNPGTWLLSQLILVEPAGHYKLNFAGRMKKIVTGGPLVMSIKDAAGDTLLTGSTRLPADTSAWQPFSVEFATGTATQAIVIILQRQPCTSAPCPVFGSLNLDSFSLQRVK